jgi:hypothetical protein
MTYLVYAELVEELKAKWRESGRRASGHDDVEVNHRRWKELEKIIHREKKRNVSVLWCESKHPETA